MRYFIIIFTLVLYHQVDGAGVSKCYSCIGTCDPPLEEVDCPSTEAEYVCLSSTVTLFDVTVETKQCVTKGGAADQICASALLTGDTATCYTCGEDLCNFPSLAKVSKCYSCNDTCDDPLKKEDCPSTGDDYVCLSKTSTSGPHTYQEKKCAIKVDHMCESELANSNIDVASCYTCRKDFCNSADLPSSAKVLKCYSCDGTCDDPLKEIDCPYIEGAEFACLSAKATSGSETLDLKQCVLKRNATEQFCETAQPPRGYDLTSCRTCEEDLCNWEPAPSSGSASEARLLYVALFFFSFLLYSDKK